MQMLKDEIRERIISRARDEFHRHGFMDASMRVIAQRAGVSVSNIYNYFATKEEIFHTLTDGVARSLEALISNLPVVRDDGPSGPDLTALVLGSVFALVREHRIELLLILEGSAGTKHAAVKNTLIDTLAAIFDRNSRKGALAEGLAPEELSFLMRVLALNLVNGLIEIARQYRDEAWAEKTVKAFMGYHIGGMSRFCG